VRYIEKVYNLTILGQPWKMISFKNLNQNILTRPNNIWTGS